mgnify:CR=1 FL=1
MLTPPKQWFNPSHRPYHQLSLFSPQATGTTSQHRTPSSALPHSLSSPTFQLMLHTCIQVMLGETCSTVLH